MSAIFGLVYLNGQPVAQTDLDLMAGALLAHGPEGGGTWKQGNIGIGQQLMCITPEDFLEKQPVVSCGGHHVLVSDARIDNRPELAESLGIHPSEFSRMADSAFILRAYEKWGTECPRYLIGAFVFALYDKREHQLLIVRSPMGERSLFYHATPRSFAFASSPHALFTLPFVPREIDEQTFADYLVMMPPKPGRSFFAGVQRLQRGFSVVIRGDKVDSRRYWHLDPNRETRFARDDDYIGAFIALFDRVVSDQIRSATEVGVMMSGGLDSTSIAAVAAGLPGREGKRLATFTEVPREGFKATALPCQYPDETPFVQAMARRYENLEINLIRTPGLFYLDNIDAFFNAARAPFRNASNRVWWDAILREASRRNVRVVLTGASGNLTMSWDGKGLLPQLIQQGAWKRALYEARAIAVNEGGHSALRVLLGRGILPLLPASAWLGVQKLRHDKNPLFSMRPPWSAYSPIHPEFAAEQQVAERGREENHSFYFRPRGDYAKSRYDAMQKNEFGIDINRGCQAMFGVEARDPASDVRLLEFCLSLPEDQYSRNGTSRRLIRRSMADRLPAEVLGNQQRGFQAADWLDSLRDARGRINEEMALLAASPAATRILDLKRVQRLLEQMDLAGQNPVHKALNCRNVLEQCLMSGRFFRWFESGTV